MYKLFTTNGEGVLRNEPRFEKQAHDLACVGLVVLLTGLALWSAVLWVVLR